MVTSVLLTQQIRATSSGAARDGMQAIEGAIKDEGWKMVMLLRLSPILPFTALNYALSVTPISAWAYIWASALGIIPGTLSQKGLSHPQESCRSVLCGVITCIPWCVVTSRLMCLLPRVSVLAGERCCAVQAHCCMCTLAAWPTT